MRHDLITYGTAINQAISLARQYQGPSSPDAGSASGTSRPLVILGEAGSGKTTLPDWLANAPGVARCTANQLVNRSNPATLLGDAKLLVIDALDEVRTQRDGDAVDQLLRRLGDIGCPHFILSCRVADWRSATGTTAISEQYDERPPELHLEPFSDDDVTAVLTGRLGREKTSAVIAHLTARGLADLFGNPQTLDLVAQVAEAGMLPDSKDELFKRATDILTI
jgi:predicted NACHT family NTPase